MDILTILGEMPGDPGWTRPLPRDGGQSWMYPICIILGFVVAIVLACIKMWKRYKVSTEPFYWFILIGVPTAIFGANFGSCVLDSFWRIAGCPGGTGPGKPWSEFFTSFGSGLAIEWGVIFTVIAAFIYFPLVLKKAKFRVRDEFGPKPEVHKVSMWMYVDAIAPCILLAQFIGRWGNYCNQEVYGAVVTDEGLANWLNKFLPGMYIGGSWRQPLFFWEGIGNLIMFFVMYIGFEFIKVRKTGDIGAFYLVWYGTFRACLEPLRDQQYKSTSSIVLSIIFAAIGVIFIVCNHLIIAKQRDKKVWRTIVYKPIQSIQQSIYPSKIKRLNNKINDLAKSDDIKDANKVKQLQTENPQQAQATHSPRTEEPGNTRHFLVPLLFWACKHNPWYSVLRLRQPYNNSLVALASHENFSNCFCLSFVNIGKLSGKGNCQLSILKVCPNKIHFNGVLGFGYRSGKFFSLSFV